MLPDNLLVLERGWLSSNNIVFLEGERAALIDSGYVTQASQTLALLEHALAGRRLTRLLNTHSHSDHIGGNAALVEAFGCQVVVPHGIDATIAEWDEEALLLSPLGQSAARFRHDATLAAGDEIELGGLNWRAIAVPGHDMDALAYHNPERRILISGDALWRNGFGVIFSELLGHPEGAGGLKAARETLDVLARLPVEVVIPGHGAPFVDVEDAFERAYRRLAAFEHDVDLLVWHALKVILAFALLERRQLPRADLPVFLARLSFCQSVNARYLNLSNEVLAHRLARDLIRVGTLRDEQGVLVAM
ncbi:MAG: glyoxylase-like metal-dependent hydrolase (beta-lactamase superfamily II) [Candidatus Accumulibacter regalis]|jgi:glyoxylase-like metal-dependent hydrolase (beta-lactamase superfamily II)|uniref:MBL fold metallo-hydrolase n=1 Tax=Accumulibacter sp. TaxID=2053492 RepID=UPI0012C53BD1|nr:MBL fold metallo-hydrolase [Accumulibacter sp.]MBN8514139.1 MBL fold metallo-hydrolase [Accumulibacter sp.]MBO3703086.1 MBL fold metallo-hydrolase [Accumulibacter sp.]MQM33670.1 MBL fold metallo-hydrolase [Candidatus Accumulibacter phosphatis]HRI93643.1 MBL fold metallo-hydrolase [Accumulibacter sp.]